MAFTGTAGHDKSMKEFIVEITTTIPAGTPQSEIDERRAAETANSKRLAATGNLGRLWRPVGELRSIGLWRADDEADLRENVLDKMPLHVWMTYKITPVESHPNDPGKAEAERAGTALA